LIAACILVQPSLSVIAGAGAECSLFDKLAWKVH